MCRWLGYLGSPIEPRELLYDPERSLIEQSRQHARHGRAERRRVRPGLVRPPRGPRDLPQRHAGVGGPRTCTRWRRRSSRRCSWPTCARPPAPRCRRPTATPSPGPLDVRAQRLHRRVRGPAPRHAARGAPRPVPDIKGTTDSELLFHLALTFGLEEDPIGGLERMAGFVESLGPPPGIAEPLQMTVGVSDGERLWAARYAERTGREHPLLQRGRRVAARALPGERAVRHFGADSRVVVSEPLAPLPGLWHEIPAGTALVLGKGQAEQVPFRPRPQ